MTSKSTATHPHSVNVTSFRADLHVHTCHSTLQEGFLRGLFGSESYTSPLEVYHMARREGMDFVTISDHDTIDGALEIAHLPDVFVSEEITTTFPEDGRQLHVVAVDINEAHHREVQKLRDNIYEMLQYLHRENILHFVAHPFAAVADKLTETHWEKMLLLFDVFEARNGLQKERDNRFLERILTQLPLQKIDELEEKHPNIPRLCQRRPKSLVGGSDDHGGLYIGKTYTTGEGPGLSRFLDSIRRGTSSPQGASGTYFTFGHTVYAAGYRFYKSQLVRKRRWAFLNRILTAEREGRLLARLLSRHGRPTQVGFLTKMLIGYLFRRFSKRIPLLQTLKMVIRLNKNIPLYITMFPYLFGLAQQHKNEAFTQAVRRRYLHHQDPLKIAVFLDSGTLIRSLLPSDAQTGSLKHIGDNQVEFLSCEKRCKHSPENVRLFRSVADFPFPLYPEMHLFVPPLLDILTHCESRGFTVLHALTNGPMGVAAILVAKFLKLPIIGTYYLNPVPPPSFLDNGSDVKGLASLYFNWFFRQMDRILVPSEIHLQQLQSQQGLDGKVTYIPTLAGQTDLFGVFAAPRQLLQLMFPSEVSRALWPVYQELGSSL